MVWCFPSETADDRSAGACGSDVAAAGKGLDAEREAGAAAGGVPSTEGRIPGRVGPQNMLKLRTIGIHDYSVLDGGQRIGRIRFADERMPGVWLWNGLGLGS
jgi:hypothetical protein